MKELKKLIVKELERSLGEGGWRTAKSEGLPSSWSDAKIAEELDYSASYFSKIISGQVGEKLARDLAEKLRADGPEGSRQLLKEEILRLARGEPSIRERFEAFLEPLIPAAQAWVARRNEGSRTTSSVGPPPLVFVEYRERPRAESQGAWRSLAQIMGQAVASGVHVALFSPFGDPKSAGSTMRGEHPDIRAFREDVSRSIRAVYRQMMMHARQGLDSDEDIAGRMVLFEAREPVSSGFQTRSFLRRWRDEGGNERSDVWEWVAANDRKDDAFLMKDPESVPSKVMFTQFRQVAAYWAWRWSGVDSEAEEGYALPIVGNPGADRDFSDREVWHRERCSVLLELAPDHLPWNSVDPDDCPEAVY